MGTPVTAGNNSRNTKNTGDASNSREASNSENISKLRDAATTRKPARAGTQAIAVKPAAINSKDDRMTARNNRSAKNSNSISWDATDSEQRCQNSKRKPTIHAF